MDESAGLASQRLSHSELSIQWDATLDECASVILKQWIRLGIVRRRRLLFFIMAVVFAGSTIAILNTKRGVDHLDWIVGGFMVAAMALGGVSAPWRYRLQAKRNIRRTLGSNGPISCQACFIEEGVKFVSQDQQTIFKWAGVNEAIVQEAGIDLVLKNGWIWIPRRAFRDDEHMNHCVQSVSDYVAAK